MELVYLWVENYKNIEKQGFNFSPKFDCKYDPDTNELTIDENDDYIENFFGDNINVTAIVGKNGSGKSSILFQENGSGGQAWTNNFKIIFKNNILELLEPFESDIDDDGPFIKIFSINNNTKYQYELKSSYEEFDLSSANKQYFTRQHVKDNIDDKYSIHWNTDILQQFNPDYIDETVYGYSSSRDRPNSLTEAIKNISREEDTFLYKIDFEELRNQIFNFVENEKFDLSSFIDFDIKESQYDLLFKLSHGQRSLIIFLVLLLNKINKMNNDLIIYLDEPDLSLHPQWQKRFMNNMIKILPQVKKYKFHIIFTTHSPFLLSDIPKQNIIFLDTYNKEDTEVKEEKQKVGNCRVIPHDEVMNKKQTFGANIHTLLSDSFFMEDGLMGEFAKGKINKIIRFLNGENRFIDFPIEQIEKVINTIGEPFLKSKLLDMYNRRFIDDYKIREQKRIDEQIRILQEKRENL